MDRAAQVRDVLQGLVRGGRRHGAAMVTRDGLPVQAAMGRPVGEDSFAAMSAALLGAAEAALQEWTAAGRPERATIQGAGMRLAVQGLDGDFLLVTVGLDDEGPEARAELDKAVMELRRVLAPPVAARAR